MGGVHRADEIRPGMKGFGLTVFKGFEPDTFDIEVLGLKSWWIGLTNIPVARIKLSGGPEDFPIEYVGVAFGMSGSPIYVYTDEGIKLLGALAYGRGFDKDALAGVQLAETMLKGGENIINGNPGALSQFMNEGWFKPLLFSGPFPVSGQVNRLFRAGGLFIDSDSSGLVNTDTASVSRKIKPGSTINVHLVTGDIDLFANGTVAMVNGSSFTGFGHSFFGTGKTQLPVTAPRMLTTAANWYGSYKDPEANGDFVGTIEYDYYWGIKGTVGKKADMVPLAFNLKYGESEKQVHCSVAKIPDRTNWIISLIAYYILSDGYGEFNLAHQLKEGSVRINLKLQVDGLGELEILPYIGTYNQETVDDVFKDYLFDMWKQVFNVLAKSGLSVKSVDFDIEYVSGNYDLLSLASTNFDRYKASPGDSLNLFLTLRSRDKETEYKKRIPFIVPEGIATGQVAVQIKTGDQLFWKELIKDEKLSADKVADIITAFNNVSLFIKADFTELNITELESMAVEEDSAVVDSAGWNIIFHQEKNVLIFTVFEQVLSPKNRDVHIIANETLYIEIVSKEEAEAEKKRIEAEKKKNKKKWIIF